MARKKYGNRQAVRGSITFASQAEARRYDELMLLLSAGKIRDLRLQPEYELAAGYVTPQGERVRGLKYVADFSYQRPTEPDATGQVYWLPVVEDVKGVRTDVYRIKRKLFRDLYGFDVVEIDA